MARNVSIDQEDLIVHDKATNSIAALADTIIDERPNPEAEFLAAERERVLKVRIKRALRKVSATNRKAMLMRVVDGLRTREVAETLAVSGSTVKTRNRRAKAQLRAALEAS